MHELQNLSRAGPGAAGGDIAVVASRPGLTEGKPFDADRSLPNLPVESRQRQMPPSAAAFKQHTYGHIAAGDRLGSSDPLDRPLILVGREVAKVDDAPLTCSGVGGGAGAQWVKWKSVRWLRHREM